MKDSNRLKWLKIAGWVLVPYIMILFTFKRLHGGKRIAGVAWAVVALIIAIVAQQDTTDATVAKTDPTPAATATDEKPVTTDKKADAVVTETIVPAEEEDVAAEPVTEEAVVAPAEKPMAEPSIEPAIAGDWRAEIEKIASSDGSTTEKADAAALLKNKVTIGVDEEKGFRQDIVAEYKSGKYLTGLDDELYALTNIFKAALVEDRSEGMPIGEFAFDFWQNTKDVFRGINDSVESNEEQMEKALAKMQ